MAVFDDYSGSFNQQMMQQMQAMQSTQLLTAQTLSNLNQQVGSLGSNMMHSGFNAVARPIMQDTSSFMNNSMGMGSTLFHTAITNPNKYSVEQQRRMALDVGTSATQWGLSGIKWGADILGTVGAISGVGGLAGGVASLGLFPLASMAASHASDMIAQNRDLSGFFMQESYKFMPSDKMMNPLNYGLNLKGAQSFSKEMINLNQRVAMDSDEFNSVVKGLTSSGLMVGTGGNMSEFKEKLLESVQFVRSSAKILDETHGEIIQMMSDFKKLGISTANFDVESAKLKGIGSMTGTSVSVIAEQLKGLTQGQTAGTALDANSVYQRNVSLSGFYGSLYEKDPHGTVGRLIEQSGGAVGASSIFGSAASQIFGNSGFAIPLGAMLLNPDKSSPTGFSIDNQGMNTLMKGNLNMQQLIDAGKSKLNTFSETDKMSFTPDRVSRMLGSMDGGKQIGVIQNLVDSMRNMPQFRGMDTIGILQRGFGLGYDQAFLTAQAIDASRSGEYSRIENKTSLNALIMAGNTAKATFKTTIFDDFKYGFEDLMDSSLGGPALGINNSLTNLVDSHFNRYSSIRGTDALDYKPSTNKFEFSNEGARKLDSSGTEQSTSANSALEIAASKLRDMGIDIGGGFKMMSRMKPEERAKHLQTVAETVKRELIKNKGTPSEKYLLAAAKALGVSAGAVVDSADYKKSLSANVQTALGIVFKYSDSEKSGDDIKRIGHDIEDFSNYDSKSNNRWFYMRHGEIGKMARGTNQEYTSSLQEYLKSSLSKKGYDMDGFAMGPEGIDNIIAGVKEGAKGLSAQSFIKLDSIGAELKSELAKGVSGNSSEAMTKLIMEITDLINKADKTTKDDKDKTGNTAAGMEGTLESHKQTLENVMKTLSEEIDIMDKYVPGSGADTGPKPVVGRHGGGWWG